MKGIILANWTTEPQPFGPNHAPLLEGLSSIDGVTPVPVAVDPATGRLLTSSSGGSAGTQYTEGATTSPGIGTLSLARYLSTPPSLTNGQMNALQLDSAGNLKVTGSLSVGGTTDNSAFTAGTSTGTPSMGFYHSTIDAVTDGRSAVVAITANRAQHSNLRNASGTEVGTASTPLQVSIANTGANATAVKVDGSAVTQPVSGTVTTTPPSNASTNVTQWNGNTVTLNKGASDAGTLRVTLGDGAQAIGSITNTAFTANIGTTNGLALDASVTGLQVAQGSTTSGQKGGLTLGAVTTAAPTYVTAQSSPFSLDTSGNLRTSVNNTVTVSGTVTANAGTGTFNIQSNASVNVAQLAGTTTSVNNGTTDAGTLRVTLSSDSTGQVKLATGANVIGSISNTSFTATQATAANLNAQVAGDVASGSSDSGNPVKQGAVAHTAAPTAVTDGQRVNLIADKVGKQVVVGSIRDLKGNQFTTITSSTSETTVITAVASTFLDVYGCIVENTSASGSKVTFKDSTAGTTQFEIYVPAGDTRGFMLPESAAFKQTTVNNNWTATCGTSVASIVISMLYVKNI